MKPARSGHLPINGLQLYYEEHGEPGASEAVPLLLIPGAFQSTDSMKQWVAAFVAKRPVIVFDQQGHGRTADTPRTMSYEQFGDDAAALLDALAVESADVMGYSQGGAVALQLALRHPQVVSKLITLGAPYRRDGWYPSVWQGLEGLSGDLFADTPVGEAFRQHTADPEAFDAYIEKMRVLGIEDQNISDEQMRSIQAKTMVVVGDADGGEARARRGDVQAARWWRRGSGGDGSDHQRPPGQTRHPPCDFSHLYPDSRAGPRADDHRVPGRRASSQSIALVTGRGAAHRRLHP